MSHDQWAAGPAASSSTRRPAGPGSRVGDPAFLDFLVARRDEEARAAAARRAHTSDDAARRSARGLAVLDDLVETVRSGRDVDSTSLHLLKIGYGRHPDFRPEWHATHD